MTPVLRLRTSCAPPILKNCNIKKICCDSKMQTTRSNWFKKKNFANEAAKGSFVLFEFSRQDVESLLEPFRLSKHRAGHCVGQELPSWNCHVWHVSLPEFPPLLLLFLRGDTHSYSCYFTSFGVSFVMVWPGNSDRIVPVDKVHIFRV